jgi:hypothetical protein
MVELAGFKTKSPAPISTDRWKSHAGLVFLAMTCLGYLISKRLNRQRGNIPSNPLKQL